MSESGRSGTCCICGRVTSNIHMHHTIPRSLGGEDSLQIPLDGDCHTKLHAHASALVARSNGKRKKAVVSPWSVEEEERARRWLLVLVESMLNPPDSYEKLTLLPQLRINCELRHAIEILKRDNSLSNMENALMYCIHHTLKYHGILENDNYNNNQNSSNQNQERKLRRLQRTKPSKARNTRRNL